jgi:hypothetical protein
LRTPHSIINHPTAAKTVILECGAPLQILLHIVIFRYTYDRGMWRYKITVIAHSSANQVKTMGAKSQDQFAAERYIHYK